MERKTNKMAVVGFILSFFLGLLGLIFSIVALNQIKKTGEEGKDFAIAGLVISIIGVVIFFIGIFLTLFVLPTLQNSIKTQTICNNGAGYVIGKYREPGYVSCTKVYSDGTYVCDYYDSASGDTYSVICEDN